MDANLGRLTSYTLKLHADRTEPAIARGECWECESFAVPLWQYGQILICARCVGRRRRARQKLEDEG